MSLGMSLSKKYDFFLKTCFTCFVHLTTKGKVENLLDPKKSTGNCCSTSKQIKYY